MTSSSTTAPPGRPQRPRPGKAVIRRRRIVAALAALVVVVTLVAAGGYGYAQWRFHQIRRDNVVGLKPVGAVPANGQHSAVGASSAPYNILLVGDNCRNCLNGTQSAAFGTAAQVGGGRSDVTMLLHVDPATNHVAILSIPRDLWLPIPNSTSEIRVDAALNNGPGALVTTIEDALNIPINHYVELNFDTFQQVVNALGGVNMYFPNPLYDSYSGLNAPTGCYHLNGTQALTVVRARHTYYQQNGIWKYDGLGDISRIQRDHEFLKVLAGAVVSQGLGNPIVDNRLIGAVTKDVTIDSTFTLGGLAQLAQILGRVNLAGAPQTTLPVDENNSPNGFVYKGSQYGSVVFPSNAGDLAAIQAFLGGGVPDATLSPAALPVTVTNGSGIGGQAESVASSLRTLGFPVAAISSGTVNSTPAETVVYYAPGNEPQAQRLADELGGAVALGQNQAIAGSGLTLITGTNLTVAGPAAPASTPTGTTAPSTAPAPVAPPSATPLGGLTAPNPAYPAFDPRGCPAGATAQPLPALPPPSPSVLPIP